MAQTQFSATERNLMRQDALRRRQEMRRPPPQTAPPPPPPPKDVAPEPPPAQRKPAAENPLQSLLGSMDRDKLLLLALLFVIWRDGGEYRLLAALAYVLL